MHKRIWISVEPFPVSTVNKMPESSQGLQHELSLRVSFHFPCSLSLCYRKPASIRVVCDVQEKYQKVYDVPTELVHNAAIANTADETGSAGAAGSLMPPVSMPLHRGGKFVSFKLEKWGFKHDVAKVLSSHLISSRAVCKISSSLGLHDVSSVSMYLLPGSRLSNIFALLIHEMTIQKYILCYLRICTQCIRCIWHGHRVTPINFNCT